MLQVVRKLTQKDALLDLLLDPLCQQSESPETILATATTK